jgi:hypothetical protein
MAKRKYRAANRIDAIGGKFDQAGKLVEAGKVVEANELVELDEKIAEPFVAGGSLAAVETEPKPG